MPEFGSPDRDCRLSEWTCPVRGFRCSSFNWQRHQLCPCESMFRLAATRSCCRRHRSLQMLADICGTYPDSDICPSRAEWWNRSVAESVNFEHSPVIHAGSLIRIWIVRHVRVTRGAGSHQTTGYSRNRNLRQQTAYLVSIRRNYPKGFECRLQFVQVQNQISNESLKAGITGCSSQQSLIRFIKAKAESSSP